MSAAGTATATNNTASAASLWAQFVSWAEAEVSALEGDIATIFAKIEPVIEADVVAAVQAFGQTVVQDVISLLSSGLPSGETISTAADNLIQNVEAQGKTIAVSTANTIASQAVTAVQSVVNAKVSSSG